MNDDNRTTFGMLNEHSHPRPSYSLTVQHAISTLESMVASRASDKILLLLEREQIQEGALLLIEHLLRSPSCQHLLVVMNKRVTSTMLAAWEQAVCGEAQTPLSTQFRVTARLQDVEQAQVYVTSIVDLQLQQIGMKSTDPFFTRFDVVLLYEVPANPGPRYYQIMDLFALTTPVIGVSAALSKEAGETFFGAVIDPSSFPISPV